MSMSHHDTEPDFGTMRPPPLNLASGNGAHDGSGAVVPAWVMQRLDELQEYRHREVLARLKRLDHKLGTSLELTNAQAERLAKQIGATSQKVDAIAARQVPRWVSLAFFALVGSSCAVIAADILRRWAESHG